MNEDNLIPKPNISENREVKSPETNADSLAEQIPSRPDMDSVIAQSEAVSSFSCDSSAYKEESSESPSEGSFEKRKDSDKKKRPGDKLQQTGKNRLRRKEGNRSKNTRRNKKVPLHYYIIFYGVPFFLSVVAVVLLVWRYQTSSDIEKTPIKSSQQKEVDLQAMMDEAVLLSKKQESIFVEAMEFYKYKEWESYRKKLLECQDILLEAIIQGEKTWALQIKIIGQEKYKSAEKIEKFAFERYGGHKQRIQLWQQSLRDIENRLKEVLGKK